MTTESHVGVFRKVAYRTLDNSFLEIPSRRQDRDENAACAFEII